MNSFIVNGRDPSSSTPVSRRRFLGGLGASTCGAMSSLPALNTLLNLQLSEGVAAASTPTTGEYRALVCVFLGGGNDSFNMLVPREPAAYAEYRASRGILALPPEQLLPIQPIGLPAYAVHAGMPEVAALFEAGQAAFVANVGTLIERVANRTEVEKNLRRLPLGLYSHSDQLEQWQTSVPQSRSGIGWGGRMADLLAQLNANRVVPMQISLDGNNVWQTGRSEVVYAITPEGSVGLTGYRPRWEPNQAVANALSTAVDSQLALQQSNLLAQTFNVGKRQALEANDVFSNATAKPLPSGVEFPGTYLGYRLEMIARAIQGRSVIGAQRQTFFVFWDGWDHHGEVLETQGAMLPQVSAAIGAFQQAMNALGTDKSVTLFTASDFGRTLTSNAKGSDHAWGGNQLVVGGAVRGRRLFGQFPSLALNPERGAERNPLDTGRGRFIPTTSCDEFFAELALWLGVSPTNLPSVFPNIGNFYSPGSSLPPVGFVV